MQILMREEVQFSLQARNQLGTQTGWRIFWGEPKFYIKYNGYAYNLTM